MVLCRLPSGKVEFDYTTNVIDTLLGKPDGSQLYYVHIVKDVPEDIIFLLKNKCTSFHFSEEAKMKHLFFELHFFASQYTYCL